MFKLSIAGQMNKRKLHQFYCIEKVVFEEEPDQEFLMFHGNENKI